MNFVLLHGVGIGTGLGWWAIRFIKEITMPMSLWILTACILWGLSILTIIDCKRHQIPNDFLKLLLGIWGIVMTFDIIIHEKDGLELLFMSLLGAFVGGGIFLLCYVISGKRLGAGDVKLVFLLGLFLTGQRIIEVIFYSTLLSLLFCLFQLYGRKMEKRKEFPMTPFFYLGTWITFFTLY